MKRTLVCALALGTFSGSAAGQQLDFHPHVTQTSEKVGGALTNRLLREEGPDLVRVIIESHDQPLDAAGLRAWGGTIEESMGSLHRVLVPRASVAHVADHVVGVSFIRLPFQPEEVSRGYVSQGVPLSGAERWHEQGLKGKGVSVAVIDLGFAGLSDAIEFEDLPADVVRVNYAPGPFESFTYHGTAVAEIVYEMAPEARLHLIRVQDEIDLAKAVTYCRREQIPIINHSVGWFNTNYYDGRGIICDIARRATNDGILWINAAGNSAQRHFEGVFQDADDDAWFDFAPGDETIQMIAVVGTPVRLAMTWDAWDSRDVDLDLYLMNERGEVVASSQGRQGGGAPTELIEFVIPETGAYGIAIRHVRGRTDVGVELYSLTLDLEEQHRVPSSSLVAPADAPEVLTVGAVHWTSYEEGPQQRYSSQGPNNAGVAKPNLVGPDAVNSSIYGIFSGTSASAPHLAGAAALILSHESSHTSETLQHALSSMAIPLGEDSIFGHGNLWLWDDLSPWPDPLTLAGPPELVDARSIRLRAEEAWDAHPVDYSFVCFNDPRFTTPYGMARDVVVSSLRANTTYDFGVRARDRSPLQNEGKPGDAHRFTTLVESPRGVRLESVSATRLRVGIDGAFTAFDSGETGLRLECDELGAPANLWTRDRQFEFDSVRPDMAYEFFAQSRNAEGRAGARVGPFEFVTDAVAPPAPIPTIAGTQISIGLDAGENPLTTELTLWDSASGLYLRPSGRTSREPAFYPASGWTRVSTASLEPGTYRLRSQARNQSGRLSGFSPTLVLILEPSESIPEARAELEGHSSPLEPVTNDFFDNGQFGSTETTVAPFSLRAWSDGNRVRLGVEGANLERARWHLFRDGTLLGTQGSPEFEDESLEANRRYRYEVSVERKDGLLLGRDTIDIVTPAETPSHWTMHDFSPRSMRIQVPAGRWEQLRFLVEQPGEESRVTSWIEHELELSDLDPVAPIHLSVQARNQVGALTPWRFLTRVGLPPEPPQVIAKWRSEGTERASLVLDLSGGVADGLEMALYDPSTNRYVGAGGQRFRSPSFSPKERYRRITWADSLPRRIQILARRKGGIAARSTITTVTSPPKVETAEKASLAVARHRAPWTLSWKEEPSFNESGHVVLSFLTDGPWPDAAVVIERSGGGETTRLSVESSQGTYVDSSLHPNRLYRYRLAVQKPDGGWHYLGPAKPIRTRLDVRGARVVQSEWHALIVLVEGDFSGLGEGRSQLQVVARSGDFERSYVTTVPRVVLVDLEPNTDYEIEVVALNVDGHRGAKTVLRARTREWESAAMRIGFRGEHELALEWAAPKSSDRSLTLPFAVYERCRGLYLTPDGRWNARPEWASADAWSYVPLRRLSSGQSFEFQVQRRSDDGGVIAYGAILEATTKPQ